MDSLGSWELIYFNTTEKEKYKGNDYADDRNILHVIAQ